MCSSIPACINTMYSGVHSSAETQMTFYVLHYHCVHFFIHMWYNYTYCVCVCNGIRIHIHTNSGRKTSHSQILICQFMHQSALSLEVSLLSSNLPLSPSLPTLAPSLTHSLTHTHSLTCLLTHSHTHPLTPFPSSFHGNCMHLKVDTNSSNSHTYLNSNISHIVIRVTNVLATDKTGTIEGILCFLDVIGW